MSLTVTIHERSEYNASARARGRDERSARYKELPIRRTLNNKAAILGADTPWSARAQQRIIPQRYVSFLPLPAAPATPAATSERASERRPESTGLRLELSTRVIISHIASNGMCKFLSITHWTQHQRRGYRDTYTEGKMYQKIKEKLF